MAADAPTAFFSYSREDAEFALRLAEDLKAAGAKCGSINWTSQEARIGRLRSNRPCADALA